MDNTEMTRNDGNAKEASLLPNVLVIVGSLRERSFNRQMAEYACTILEGVAQVHILDWKDVPIFNQDEEYPAPVSVEQVRAAVREADAIWVFTPEYNHGVPGPLKNLIDWLSRPPEDGSPAVINGKTVTVSGVGGSGCVRHCFEALLPTLDFLNLDIPAATFYGATLDRAMFTSAELVLNEAAKAALKDQAEKLIAKIPVE